MPVRSNRVIISAAVPAGASGVSYTVPSGRTLVVKCITSWAVTGTATVCIVSVAELGGTEVRVIRDNQAGDSVVRYTDLFIVAEAGDVVRVTRGAGALGITVSGALLLGDPA